jgi:hypothetical protein
MEMFIEMSPPNGYESKIGLMAKSGVAILFFLEYVPNLYELAHNKNIQTRTQSLVIVFSVQSFKPIREQ